MEPQFQHYNAAIG